MKIYELFKKIRYFSIIVFFISYTISGISLFIESYFYSLIKQNLRFFGIADGISYILSFLSVLSFMISQLYLISSYLYIKGFKHLLNWSFYLNKFKQKQKKLWIEGIKIGFIFGLLAIPVGTFLLVLVTSFINAINSIFMHVSWTCPVLEQMPIPCSFLDSVLSNLAVVPLVTIFYGFYILLIVAVVFAFLGGIIGVIISELIKKTSKKQK